LTNISKKIRSGIFYTALSKYSNIVVSIFISMVLARLLTPAEFGVVAMISVFISFFNLLSSFGIAPAIVQNKSLSEDDVSSIFTFSIAIGLFLSAIFFFAAPLIASFYNEPILTGLTRLMALSIFFNSLQIVPNAQNLKRLRFKQIGIISVIVNIICGIIAIILAYLGFSYYTLVINSILTALFTFIAYYILSPVKPSLWIQISSIQKIARFSFYQLSFNFINYFSRNLDNLLIGKFFSPSALGLYDKSYRLMKMPLQNLTFVITPVLHPVLSNYQDDKRLIYNAHYKIVKLLAIIGFPLSIFFYFSSSEIINIMYGPQWEQSIPVFELLALSIGIQIVLSSTGSIFQATNRTDLMFLSGFLSAILTVGGIIYGVFIGKSLVSVSYGLIIAFSINFFQGLYLLIVKSLNQSYLNFLKVFIFPLITSISIAVVLWLLSGIIINNIIISFTVKIFATIVVFGIILISSKDNLRFIKEYFGKMFKR
jgi:teichuronic acid exporter